MGVITGFYGILTQTLNESARILASYNIHVAGMLAATAVSSISFRYTPEVMKEPCYSSSEVLLQHCLPKIAHMTENVTPVIETISLKTEGCVFPQSGPNSQSPVYNVPGSITAIQRP